MKIYLVMFITLFVMFYAVLFALSYDSRVTNCSTKTNLAFSCIGAALATASAYVVDKVADFMIYVVCSVGC